MDNRVNAHFTQEIEKFGKSNWNECYHCGQCTALCPLTRDDQMFPRKSIRYMQLGLSGPLSRGLEPWLCYYCGDCSTSCPRDANPGEIMMAMRRYLTSVYDWTGLSKRFYTSKVWELAYVILFAAIAFILLVIVNPNPIITELNPDGGVQLNKMFPTLWVEAGDWIMAILVAGLLISNILRMFYKTILKDPHIKVPILLYFKELWKLVFHFITQGKFSKCDDKNYWLSHWFLMTGYTIMFIVIVVYLPWFQTEAIHPWYHPQRMLGYYATFGLLFGLLVAIIGRVKKEKVKFKFSHVTDWLFIIMLSLTTVTGILIHVFRIYGMPVATYISYVAHMVVLVPMICIEVPFSKWSHLAYRPFAIYFAAIKKAAVRIA